MANYRLSREADRDILAIATFTLEHWSEAQADKYVMGLHEAFIRLADNPQRGTKCSDLRPGYFRHRYRSHVVFYKPDDDGILVVRVLHGQMDYIRHL